MPRMSMDDSYRVALKELNDHLICVLCGGYYISATTINECLHTFCKDCIVRYLETSIYCPICDVLVHKTRPLLCLRRDHIIQDLVYKMVPGLLTGEVERRKEFHSSGNDKNPAPLSLDEDDVTRRAGKFFTEKEKVSLQLVFSTNGRPVPNQKKRGRGRPRKSSLMPADNVVYRTYLLCPAPVTVGLIKRFLQHKLDLSPKLQIDVFHTTETLKDHYTLMDVSYIYCWARMEPLTLHYSIYDPSPKISIPVQIPTKRLTYTLPTEGGATCGAISPPPSPTSSAGSSPEFGTRIRSFNQGFYIRETSTNSTKNNKIPDKIVENSPAVREVNFSRKRDRKRKRGMPKKLVTAGLQNSESRSFTFQSMQRDYKRRFPGMTIPISFPLGQLSDIEFEKSDINSDNEGCSIRGALVLSDGESDKPIERVPRSSTPIARSSSGSDSDAKGVRSSSTKSTDNDSGYEASDMPKTFEMLKFNSDEETD